MCDISYFHQILISLCLSKILDNFKVVFLFKLIFFAICSISFLPSEYIKKSINLFKTKLGKNSVFFSYPFGEYSISFKNIIISLGFKYAFGQHSGVIDETKNFYELPRFPINEKYGEINRFTSLTKTLPFKYKNIFPEEKYLLDSKNPPKVKIEFYENIKNLKSLNCYSNEANKWRKSEIAFISSNVLQIYIKDKLINYIIK